MPIVALTDITVRTLRPMPGKQVTYIDRGLKGFGVRVAPSGAMTWVVTYGPQRTRVKLGAVGIISLKDARAAARQRLAEHQLGIVPDKGRETYETALSAFLAAAEKRNKPRTVRDYRRLLTRHGFGKVKLDDIITPISPTPLMPSALTCGSCSSTRMASSDGTSAFTGT